MSATILTFHTLTTVSVGSTPQGVGSYSNVYEPPGVKTRYIRNGLFEAISEYKAYAQSVKFAILLHHVAKKTNFSPIYSL